MFTANKPRSSLWVDKYSPKSFFELLSEEKVNRNVLSWLKDWDGIVFKKEVKPSALTQRYNSNTARRGGTSNRPPLNPTLTSLVSPDKKMRDGPAIKIILISGNPGIGKTTLAKIIARHCGYEPVEFNASDDRGASTFLPKVLDVVENSSVFEERGNANGGASKPRCLIIDEIDGVVGGEARGAIKGLIDLIDGDIRASRKGPAKPKQDDVEESPAGENDPEQATGDGDAPASPTKKKNQPKRLRRPIICICNDPWVPALRPLRDRAVVFRLEPPSLPSLLTRLQSVCKAEGVRVDAGFLQALAELTNRDIRACLNTLQFLSSKSKNLTPDMLGSAAIGSKDLQTSVFDLWRSIFVKEQKSAFLQHVLQQSARREAALQENGAPGNYLPPVEQAAANPSAREQQLFASVAQADVDRVLEGCWENYPSIRYSDPLLNRTSKVADWMEAVSVIWQEMRAHQMFGLAAYLPAVAVGFHQNCRVSYIAKPLQPPRLEMGFRPRREHHETVLKSFRSGVRLNHHHI
jgi:chromosome transmission fidelity protein 18